MAASYLSCFEHDSIAISECGGPAALSEREALVLESVGEKLPGFCARGNRSLKLAQHCGLVGIGGRVLEILPKAGEHLDSTQSRGVLLRLLKTSPDFQIYRQAGVGQDQRSAPLMDIFIGAFFDEVAKLVKGGLLHRYLEEQDDCIAVRGSINVGRQLTVLANRTDRIACRYDELTADNRWNRILKLGLRIVRPWMHSVVLQRRWIGLIAGFDGVADFSDPRPLLAGLSYDRQGMRYRSAVDWVERIVNLLSPGLRAGDNTAPGLLFDMNRLFEGAVTQCMGRWTSACGWTLEAQNSTRFLCQISDERNRNAFRVRPDLLFSARGRTVAIADAKWKRLQRSASGFMLPDQGDLYQLLAYASVFNCDKLALVYPWMEDLEGARETVLQLPTIGQLKPIVSIICVDVTNDQLPLRMKGDNWCRTVGRVHD